MISKLKEMVMERGFDEALGTFDEEEFGDLLIEMLSLHSGSTTAIKSLIKTLLLAYVDFYKDPESVEELVNPILAAVKGKY